MLLHDRPLGNSDREPCRVARNEVRGHAMGAKNPFRLRADPRQSGAGTLLRTSVWKQTRSTRQLSKAWRSMRNLLSVFAAVRIAEGRTRCSRFRMRPAYCVHGKDGFRARPSARGSRSGLSRSRDHPPTARWRKARRFLRPATPVPSPCTSASRLPCGTGLQR